MWNIRSNVIPKAHRKRPSATASLAILLSLSGAAFIASAADGQAAVSSAPAGVPAQATFAIPESIVADCSRPVDADINRWLASLPDNSTAVFEANGCYAQDGTIFVTDHTNFTVNGNGSRFTAVTKGTSNRDNWRIVAGAQIKLENMTVRGANPHAGSGPEAYVLGFEWQHGFRFAGTQGGVLQDVQASDVYGDFVEAHNDIRPDKRSELPARDIEVVRGHFQRSGRQGVGLTDVDGFTLRNSSIADVPMTAIDIEPDGPLQLARRVLITNSTFGSIHHSVLSVGGAIGPDDHVGAISFVGNSMPGNPTFGTNTCQSPISVVAPAARPIRQLRFTNNRLHTFSDAFYLRSVRDVVISGNDVNHRDGGCERLSGLNLLNGSGVTVTNNAFRNAVKVISLDSTSAAPVETGNRRA